MRSVPEPQSGSTSVGCIALRRTGRTRSACHHLRPAGAHQDRRRQVLLERRLGLRALLAVSAPVQALPREVEAQRRRRAPLVQVQAHVGTAHVDRRALPEALAELVDDRVLHPLRDEVRVGELPWAGARRRRRPRACRSARDATTSRCSAPRRRAAADRRPRSSPAAAGCGSRAATTGRRDRRGRAVRRRTPPRAGRGLRPRPARSSSPASSSSIPLGQVAKKLRSSRPADIRVRDIRVHERQR